MFSVIVCFISIIQKNFLRDIGIWFLFFVRRLFYLKLLRTFMSICLLINSLDILFYALIHFFVLLFIFFCIIILILDILMFFLSVVLKLNYSTLSIIPHTRFLVIEIFRLFCMLWLFWLFWMLILILLLLFYYFFRKGPFLTLIFWTLYMIMLKWRWIFFNLLRFWRRIWHYFNLRMLIYCN